MTASRPLCRTPGKGHRSVVRASVYDSVKTSVSDTRKRAPFISRDKCEFQIFDRAEKTKTLELPEESADPDGP